MELPDPVRQRLSNLSLTMFGDSSRTGPESSEAAGEWQGGPRGGVALGRAAAQALPGSKMAATASARVLSWVRRPRPCGGPGRPRASVAAATAPGGTVAERIGKQSA